MFNARSLLTDRTARVREQIPYFRALLALALVTVSLANAQDNQYWTQQYGARAMLMGGAAMANAADQAVLFYNPGAVRKVQGAGITASANFLYLQWLKAKDLSDLGVDVTDSNTDVAPRLLVGSFDMKGDRGWRISAGFVTNVYGRFEVQQTNSFRRDLDTQQAGVELVSGLLNNFVQTREDLVGLGVSRSVGAMGSLGATLFGSSFSQRYMRTVDLGLYGDPELNDVLPTLKGYISTERGDVSNLGFQLKAGYYHAGPRHQWGLAVTAPRISTHLWKGRMYRATTEVRNDVVVEKLLLSGGDLETSYRTPWLVNVGFETRGDASVWAFRLGYASAVPGYDRMVLTAADDLNHGALVPNEGTIRRVRSAAVQVLNAGIGAQFRLSPTADLLAGFRTDRNFLDRTQLDPATDITGTFSYWDLYHASCGVDLHSERMKLTVGVVYSFGIDTSSPGEFRELDDLVRSGPDVLFRINYNQLGLTLGFSYFVLGKQAEAPE